MRNPGIIETLIDRIMKCLSLRNMILSGHDSVLVPNFRGEHLASMGSLHPTHRAEAKRRRPVAPKASEGGNPCDPQNPWWRDLSPIANQKSKIANPPEIPLFPSMNPQKALISHFFRSKSFFIPPPCRAEASEGGLSRRPVRHSFSDGGSFSAGNQ